MIALEEILKLPKERRIEIINAIWDSIAKEENNSELTEEQLHELRTRRSAYDQGAMPVYSWQEAKESIIKK